MNLPVSRFGVIGQPVAHSLSPQIHAAFARQFAIDLDYALIAAPLDDFGSTVAAFFADGGCGLNVTLPFKREAFVLCGSAVSSRAAQAGAVNWLAADARGLTGDNTDGVGLVRDLRRVLGDAGLSRAGVLLLGAGGAARGVARPLRDATSGQLTIAARDRRKAEQLLVECSLRAEGNVAAIGIDQLADDAYDVVVNATSASVGGQRLSSSPRIFAKAKLAYDMMYGAVPGAFLVDARAAGAAAIADGLGMLVEQAAESFRLWHGVDPDTPPVLEAMRAMLSAGQR